MIERIILENKRAKTLLWINEDLVDLTIPNKPLFSSREEYENTHGKYAFNFSFDSAISSADGTYVVLYKRLGTKGVILKNNELLREINRSYYYAEVYEYPVVFATLSNGRTYLIHCPQEYNLLELEDAETGEILNCNMKRDSSDFFHSRLEVSPNNKYLVSKGWVWHPFDQIAVYNLEECLTNPKLLDKIQYQPSTNAEVSTASFADDNHLLIGASTDADKWDDEATDDLDNGQLGIWDIENNSKIGIIRPKTADIGYLVAIDRTYAWDLYKYPKIINITTGEIVYKAEDINSGTQSSSIIHHLRGLPQIAISQNKKDIAILTDEGKLKILRYKN